MKYFILNGSILTTTHTCCICGYLNSSVGLDICCIWHWKRRRPILNLEGKLVWVKQMNLTLYYTIGQTTFTSSCTIAEDFCTIAYLLTSPPIARKATSKYTIGTSISIIACFIKIKMMYEVNKARLILGFISIHQN